MRTGRSARRRCRPARSPASPAHRDRPARPYAARVAHPPDAERTQVGTGCRWSTPRSRACRPGAAAPPARAGWSARVRCARRPAGRRAAPEAAARPRHASPDRGTPASGVDRHRTAGPTSHPVRTDVHRAPVAPRPAAARTPGRERRPAAGRSRCPPVRSRGSRWAAVQERCLPTCSNPGSTRPRSSVVRTAAPRPHRARWAAGRSAARDRSSPAWRSGSTRSMPNRNRQAGIRPAGTERSRSGSAPDGSGRPPRAAATNRPPTAASRAATHPATHPGAARQAPLHCRPLRRPASRGPARSAGPAERPG